MTATFESDGHAYRLLDAARTRVRSVTQVLKVHGMPVFPGVPLDVLEVVRVRGGIVHEAVAAENLGDLDVARFRAEFPPDVTRRVDAWLDFRVQRHFVPLVVEHIVASHRHQVAGTLDVLGLLDGQAVFLDYCTGDDIRHKALQTAGYRGLAVESAANGDEVLRLFFQKYPSVRRFAVVLRADGRFRLEQFEDAHDWRNFLTLVEAARIVAAYQPRRQEGRMTSTILDPETVKEAGAELADGAQDLANRLALSTVTDLPSMEQVLMDRQSIGAAMARVKGFFGPMKSMANLLHKNICAREAEVLGPLVRLDELKRNQIREFNDEQSRRRQVRERELAEERRREAEAYAAHEAAALEALGEHAMAAAVVEDAIAAAPPVVTLTDEVKAAGLKTRRTWHWRYTGGPADVDQTPPAVLARALDLVPKVFLRLDEAKVGTYVRAMKASGQIPGIDIYYTDDPVR